MSFSFVCSALDRDEWLRQRMTTGIGASESPVLLGLSSFSSVMELWGQKRGLIPLDSEETERMAWGLRLEPLVAEDYERKTGRRLEQWAELLRSDEHPYLLATPDYAWVREDAAIIPVEIKCTDFARKADWADGPPLRVYYQCQHQMAVTGAPMASIGLLVGGNQFFWADVERDEAAIGAILGVCGPFWAMVTRGILPPMDGNERTSAALKLIFPKAAPGEIVRLPEHACQWTADLEATKEEAKALDIKVRMLEDALKAAIGGAEIGELPDGSGAWRWANRHRKGYTVEAADYRQLVRMK